MIARTARPFAVIGWVAALAGAIGALIVRLVDPAPVVENNFGFGDAALVGMAVLGVAFATVGAVLVVRRPDNIIGWLMVVIGDGYAIGMFWAVVTSSVAAHGPALGWLDLQLAGWLTVLFTSLGGAVFAIGFVFPTGRGHTPAWDRALKVGAILSPFMFLSVFLIRPGPLHLFPRITNPFGLGLDPRPWMGDDPSTRISAMAVVFMPLVLWSVVSRYRQAGHVERQQLKWFGMATAVTIAVLGLTGASAYLFKDPPEIGLALFGFVGALVPVAIGIAILRYGLYDIDRIISRTLSYAIVTGVLGAVFVGIILLFQTAFTGVTGSNGIPVAISTLAVFALFQPVLRRVRRSVDRRFDRARVDAELTAEAFAGRLRDETNLSAVTADLATTTRAALAPASLGIWLRRGDAR